MTMDVFRRLGSVTVRLSATGSAPVEVTWERYESLDLWPTWSPQLRRAEAVERRLRPGLTGRVIGPLGVSAGFLVTAVDPTSRRWSWSVRRWPVTVELEHGVEPEPGVGPDGAAGSRTWLAIRGPAPLVMAYAPLARYALHRLVTPSSGDGEKSG